MSGDTSRTLAGHYAGRYAGGRRMTAVGLAAGMTAPDDSLVAIGFDAARYNSGNRVTVFGYACASHHSGNDTIAIGINASKYGIADLNIAVGNYAFHNFAEGEEKIATIEDERTFRVPAHGYWPGRHYLFHLSSTGLLPRTQDRELDRVPLTVLDRDRLLLLSTSFVFRGVGQIRLRRIATSVRNNIAIGHGIPASEDDLIQIGTASHKRFHTPPPMESDAQLRTRPHSRAALPPPAKEGAFLYCRDARGEGRPGLLYSDGARWLRFDTHEPV